MDFGHLVTAGYTTIQGFLSKDEVDELLRMHANAKNDFVQRGRHNGNYSILYGSLTRSLIYKIERTIADISDNTDIKSNRILPSLMYFDNELVNFSWHQDHEAYFRFQQARSRLNFWIPLVKPDPVLSGLDVVPHDVFSQHAERIWQHHVIDQGAKTFHMRDGVQYMVDDNSDEEIQLPVSIDTMSVTPAVGPGDALILCGDTIHRSQPRQGHRVSISVLTLDENVVLDRGVFNSGGNTKRRMIVQNSANYEKLKNLLDSGNTVTVRDLLG